MRIIAALLLWLVLVGVVVAEDAIDRLDQALTFSTADNKYSARLSGLLDLEGYRYPALPPGLIYSAGELLFNPRLTLFLDGQLGPYAYFFLQARVDRGFDPGADPIRARLDEYALRISPWEDGRLQLQVGTFATVVGNWVSRHASWDNPFVGAPLVYENMTAIWDTSAADSVTTLRSWAHLIPRAGGETEYDDKRLRLPAIWGPSYTAGAMVSGQWGKIEYAVEVKNAALSSRPEVWSVEETKWEYPTVSAHLEYRANQAWNFGLSASEGVYLSPLARHTIPRNYELGDYRQIVLAQDVSYAWHYLQLWAEVYEVRFKVPTVGDADLWAYYVEAKYKFTPQLFGAIRWNEERFGRVTDAAGFNYKWGRDVTRVDLAGIYRFTAHTQLKLEYDFQLDEGRDGWESTIAAQFTLRF